MSSNPRQRPFHHSIRFKLLLVALTLAVIPWAGYRYIQETEAFLRQGQESVLLGTAQAVATVLHNRDDLFAAGNDSGWTVYVHRLHSDIQLDGYSEDWAPYLRNARHYEAANILTDGASRQAPALSFDHLVGQRDGYLYALFRVRDDRIIYSLPGEGRGRQGDHLRITLEQPGGGLARYRVATSAPGWVDARRMPEDPTDPEPLGTEPRIRGEWQETARGYTLEIRIPRYLVGDRLAFAIADVDDPAGREIRSVVSTAGSGGPDDLGRLITPSPAIERIISSLEHESARIWVLDEQGRVLAQRGTLQSSGDAVRPRKPDTPAWLHSLFRLVLRPPAGHFEDEFTGAFRLQGPEIESALNGRPEIRRRRTPDEEAVILSAAWPIRSDQGILGAVLVEQSTNAIQSLQNEALERLFSITLIFFAGTSMVLLGFATFLTARIRSLRNQVEAAVTPDGRIRGEVKTGRARDEIGDLGRSFASVLNRLGEYNRYLEAMASRLAHELRTPLTVVKTSLENLEMEQDPPERQRYIQRAKEGTEQLGLILHRMREATRLEQLLQQTEPEDFDLSALVRAAAGNYAAVYPQVDFQTSLPDRPIIVTGAPDLISQALDKLIGNAVDFHSPGTPVRLNLERRDATLTCLSISNEGPPLPEGLRQELFESMVSVRPGESPEPHLGLGLYLVRLICEFHGGKAEAANLPENRGVILSLILPAIG
ncbi:MAG TPA: proteobacterial dedicated sortase system histidine kinase [Sedimenticola sp.]|nr:proteobacterial dedicated sortase system histidine kinase [Sedimenticola sp.]